MSLKTKVLTAAAFAALLASTAVQAVTYTVGTGATYRPFEYEAPNKEIVGFDIDLMKAIAKAQGFDVEFVNTTWSTIFPGKHFKMRIAIPGCICYNIYYHAGFVHR